MEGRNFHTSVCWHYIYAFAIKSYHILTVNNALAESVYYFMERIFVSPSKVKPGGHKIE